MWRITVIAALLAILGAATPGPAPANELCPAIVEPTCPTDVTGDGDVGMPDLVQVLGDWEAPENNCWTVARVEGNWGPCPAQPGDVNGDATVDFDDIRAVLAACTTDCRVDLDRNKVVDERDVATWECLFELGNRAADFNNDHVVDFADQLILLAAVSDPPDCRFDLDGDGEIGWSDVIIVVEDEK